MADVLQACGESLYGDFMVASQESFQVLVSQLGASVTHGPSNASSNITGATGTLSPPVATYQSGTQNSQGSWRKGKGKVPSIQFISQTPATASTVPPAQKVSTKRFLEICVQWNKFHKLGEIDVSGYGGMPPSDMKVFQDAKIAYDERRSARRIFGRFTLHKPHTAKFVKVSSNSSVCLRLTHSF